MLSCYSILTSSGLMLGFFWLFKPSLQQKQVRKKRLKRSLFVSVGRFIAAPGKEVMGSLTVDLLNTLTCHDCGRKLQVQRNLIGFVHNGVTGISVRFIYLYAQQGKKRRFYLGVWPKLSLDQIQTEVQRVRGLVRDGINPTCARKAAQIKKKKEIDSWFTILEEAKTDHLTVSDLFDVWIEDGVNRINDNKELRRVFSKDVLPLIGSTEIRHLSDRDILHVLRTQRQRGVVKLALTTLADIRQMLLWAEKRQPWRAFKGYKTR